MKTHAVLIIGARSEMALAIAHAFAAAGHPIQMAARDAVSLVPERDDIALRHAVDVTLHDFDALEIETHATFVDGLPGLPEIAICAVGLMGEQSENERNMDAAVRVLRSNFEGPALILAELANRFEARGSGVLVGISSVAGDRGRATNYVYGSAKAGFTAFLSGLRNRLAAKGVHVVTVLPGFVATKMTEGMDLPEKLTAAPQEVAVAIMQAVTKGRNVIYVRSIWRLVMLVIRNIPEWLFKKLKI
ncbi:SDR family oxidoreductase [Roseovarius sp. M141]|uniref:SDR family oxidoreductase n=1 Tax=Roseovarius sp. M141 TaxID=2583806 RepID=UPI0020CF85E4|nr:SDR family oxidoreductase [Roseovarius sp. M141]MCQ0090451.1 SDR family oxidoreductase [Roseovarius sp. M141]